MTQTSTASPPDVPETLILWIFDPGTEGPPDLRRLEGFQVRYFEQLDALESELRLGPTPDAVLLSGIHEVGDTLGALCRQAPRTAFAFWSPHRDKNLAAQALAAGAQVVATDRRTAILAPRLRDAVSRQRSLRNGEPLSGKRAQEVKRGRHRHRRLVRAVANALDRDLISLLAVLDQAFAQLPKDSPLVELLDLVDLHGSRASALAQDLASYSSRRPLVPEPFDLSVLIDEAQVMVEAYLGPSRSLTLNPGFNLPMVEVDRGLARRLIVDLVIMACDARGIDLETSVALSTGARECDRGLLAEILGGDSMRTGPFVYLEVAVDLVEGPKFNNPYDRLSGLGPIELLLRRHYGGLRCREVSDRLIMQAFLPAFERAAEDATPLAKGWHAGGSVLLFEPFEPAAASVMPTLERLGFEPQDARDPDQAWTLFRAAADPFVAVILDVDQQRATTVALLERMVAARPETQVLISSGRDEAQVMADPQLAAAVGFVRKPFRVVNLRKIFRRVLNLEPTTEGANS